MTEKEEKAIEYFKKQKEICVENANICDENNFDEEAEFLREEKDYIDTVIQALEQKDKEIQELKEVNKLFIKTRARKNHTMEMRKKFITNKTGYTGVCVDNRALKRTGKEKYRAYITFQCKHFNLGTYNTLDEAIEARKKRRRIYKRIKESE